MKKTIRPATSLALLCAMLAVFSDPAAAAPGDLDLTFGGTGKVTTTFGSGDYGQSVALQSDGKIVAAGYSSGDFALVRYNADGTLDTTFAGTGKVTTDFGIGDAVGYNVAVQNDNKIVVAGSFYNGSDEDFALARYLSNGSLDTSFNGTGKVTTAFASSDDRGQSVAVQSDGKIVVAGYAYGIGNYAVFALARYNANGSLDTSFGSGGKVTTAIASDAQGASMVVQSDGKIVVAGYAYTIGGSQVFALARYLSNGSLDTDFGNGGTVTTSFGYGARGYSVAVQSDGKIVVAGESSLPANNPGFALARYNANGSLDTNFGSGGKVTTIIGDYRAYASK